MHPDDQDLQFGSYFIRNGDGSFSPVSLSEFNEITTDDVKYQHSSELQYETEVSMSFKCTNPRNVLKLWKQIQRCINGNKRHVRRNIRKREQLRRNRLKERTWNL